MTTPITTPQRYQRADWDHTARTRVVANVMLDQMEKAPDATSRNEIFGRLSRYLAGFASDEVDAQHINGRLVALGLPRVEGGSSEGRIPLSEMPIEMKQDIRRFDALRASCSKQHAVLSCIAELTGGSLSETEFAQAQSILQHAARSRG